MRLWISRNWRSLAGLVCIYAALQVYGGWRVWHGWRDEALCFVLVLIGITIASAGTNDRR